MRCPYCSGEIGIDILKATSELTACPKCTRRFRVLSTDFNDHSPNEVSDALPFIRNRMGAITAFAVREDQRFCEVCGSFYAKEEKICPNLLMALKAWFLDPTRICHIDPNLTPERVQEEIEAFLKKKVQRTVLKALLKRKAT